MSLIFSRFWVLRTPGGLALLFGLIFLADCSSTPVRVTPNAGGATPKLRIHNSSPYPLQNLTVIFPQDHISFGNVPAWATTGYREVPHGVFAYAAYQVELEGSSVYQAVVDWMGETPLAGETFTYRILVDPAQYSRNRAIQLIQVTQEEQIQP
jgi:hypothetical protein